MRGEEARWRRKMRLGGGKRVGKSIDSLCGRVDVQLVMGEEERLMREEKVSGRRWRVREGEWMAVANSHARPRLADIDCRLPCLTRGIDDPGRRCLAPER